MEPVGFALGVIPELRLHVQSMMARIEKFRRGPDAYQSLKSELGNMARLIAEVEGVLELNPNAVSNVSSPWFSSKLEKVQQYLQEAEPIMQQLCNVAFPDGSTEQPKRKKFKALYKRLTRAKANDKEMVAVEEKVKNASRVLDNLTSELSILISLGEMGKNSAAGSSEPTYAPEGSTPALPHTVSLNFNAKDAEGKPATPEAFLKHYVLADATDVIAAAGVMKPAYGVVGMAGVGKTVALQGLACDDDIQKHFLDGIHYMSFGKGATVQTVVSEIAHIMRITGANEIVDSVEKSSSVREAVNKAETWFRGRTSLFLVDDLWPTSDKTGYLHDLRQLLRRSPSSRMVVTTRSTTIAQKAGSIVHFDARDPTGAVSERIFLSYAKPFQAADACTHFGRRVKSSIRKVLLLCGGLPIALSVAGCSVAILVRSHNNFETACIEYEMELSRTKASLREEPGFVGSSLNAGILLSLQCLEPGYQKWKEDYGVDTKYTVKDLYVSLSVLRNQGWVPVSLLSRLWKLDETEAMKVANFFCDMSLATLHRRERKADGSNEERGAAEKGIMLHDLHLDFCQHQARKDETTAYWHAELLTGYYKEDENMLRLSSLGDSAETEEAALLGFESRPWWSNSIPNDGYVYDELARHLVCAGRSVELGALLLDSRWTHLRMRVGGIVALQDDFENFGCFSQGNERGFPFSKRIYESFALLFRALQQSWVRISGGRRELQFQMCGRLVKLRNSCAILNKYAESLLLYTEKPYLVPVTSFFPDPRCGELMDIQVGDSCCEVRCSPCGRYIAASTSSDVVVLDGSSGAVLRRLWQRHARRERDKLPGIETSFWLDRSIAFAPNSKTIAVSDDNTVILWAWESGSSSTVVLRGHEDAVTCVATCSGGQQLISGSADGSLRVWDIATKTATREYRQSSYVRCLALSPDGEKIALGLAGGTLRVLDSCKGAVLFEDHAEGLVELESVAFCPSGMYLAAGSFSNVHMWSTESWILTGTMGRGHANSVTFSPSGKHILAGLITEACVWNLQAGSIDRTVPNFRSRVHSVSFSDDGKRIILGSKDGRVRVLDFPLSQRLVEEPYARAQTVWNVAISRDGLRVALGLENKVQIWDAQSCVQIGELLESCRTECFSFSPDARRLISGYANGDLKLWDLETLSSSGGTRISHSRPVTCVAFSFDGLRIVSGSHDKTVRVWDAVLLMPTNIHNSFAGCDIIRHVAESVDGVYIVTSEGYNGERVCIRNRTSGKIVWTYGKRAWLENRPASFHWGQSPHLGYERVVRVSYGTMGNLESATSSEGAEIAHEIDGNEAIQIIRSCSYETSLLWPPSLLPYADNEVSVKGTQIYSNQQGKTALLGSMPGTGERFKWKYNTKTKVYVAGLGYESECVAICTAAFD